MGPAIGLVINTAAMVCIVLSMRRFWRADHPKRWWYFALGGTVFVFLIVLAVKDVTTPRHAELLESEKACSTRLC